MSKQIFRKLVIVTVLLAIMNFAVLGFSLDGTEFFGRISPSDSGCRASSPLVSKALMKRLLNESEHALTAGTTDDMPCSECYPVNETSENWCQDLTDNCFPLPWLLNNEWERKVRYFYCPGQGTSVYCDIWVDSGCCSSTDEDEPQCDPNHPRCHF